MITSTFLYEKNGFKVSKLNVDNQIYFVADKPEAKKVVRYIRKSLKILDKIIEAM